MTGPTPYRCFKTTPAVVGLAVMLDVRLRLSLRKVRDRLGPAPQTWSSDKPPLGGLGLMLVRR